MWEEIPNLYDLDETVDECCQELRKIQTDIQQMLNKLEVCKVQLLALEKK